MTKSPSSFWSAIPSRMSSKTSASNTAGMKTSPT
jgi:hypothetical protein